MADQSAAERLGIATADEIGIDTLAERLCREAVEQRACVMTPPFVGAWTNMPPWPEAAGV